MTLYEDVDSVLAEFDHADEEQRALSRRYREFVSSDENTIWRTSRAGHITASALVIDAAQSRVLLTLHPKVGRWLQLGGHLESDDSTLLEAALREVREESGIDRGSIRRRPLRLDRHEVPCGRDAHGTALASVHWDVQFLVAVPSAVDVVISDESDDLAWFSRDELPDIDASVAALVCDADLALRQSEAQQWVTFG
jgi:8-oxo-dGTP pyrophosphatase MutT (NUDIX family)